MRLLGQFGADLGGAFVVILLNTTEADISMQACAFFRTSLMFDDCYMGLHGSRYLLVQDYD